MMVTKNIESLAKRALQNVCRVQAVLYSGTSKKSVRFVAEKRKSAIPRANITLMDVFTERFREQKYVIRKLAIKEIVVIVKLRICSKVRSS